MPKPEKQSSALMTAIDTKNAIKVITLLAEGANFTDIPNNKDNFL